jgi:hypothetical protein
MSHRSVVWRDCLLQAAYGRPQPACIQYRSSCLNASVADTSSRASQARTRHDVMRARSVGGPDAVRLFDHFRGNIVGRFPQAPAQPLARRWVRWKVPVDALHCVCVCRCWLFLRFIATRSEPSCHLGSGSHGNESVLLAQQCQILCADPQWMS